MKHFGWMLLTVAVALTSSMFSVSAQDDPFSSNRSNRHAPKKDNVVVFSVSKAGADKSELLKVFAAVQMQENPRQIGPPVYLVVQRISLRDFLVHVRDDSGTLYWLRTKEDHDVADNERLQNVSAVLTGKTREYVSVLGAKKTVRELEEKEGENGMEKKELTKEDFLEKLKEGKTWTLSKFSKVKCFTCLGNGKFGALRNYARCQDCDGVGEVAADCLVKW
ncbi:MAG: hypothetical protein WCO57_05600 [Verrucomicrobiota bacterium]